MQDDSHLRRGVPVAHHIYGIPQTINTANYVYFLALKNIIQLNIPEMVNIYTEELIHLHQGQGIELYWRDSLTCPTEEEYIEMVNNSRRLFLSKTAVFLIYIFFFFRNKRSAETWCKIDASCK